MKLAANAGRLDVDRWLEEMGVGPEQFDEWVELDEIEPIGEEKLAYVMALGFAAVCNRLKYLSPFGVAKDLKDVEAKTFLFWKKKAKNKPKQESYVNPNQAALMFRMAVGNRGENRGSW